MRPHICFCLLLSVGVSGCGLKGPLYLPKQATPVQVESQSAGTPESVETATESDKRKNSGNAVATPETR